MSTALDIDLAALVGEMDAVPCEHHQHGTRPSHTDEPASHYGKSNCPKCGNGGIVAALCPGYVALVRSGVTMQCPACKHTAPAFEVVIILGPVGGPSWT